MSPSPLRARGVHCRAGRTARSLWHGTRALGFWIAVVLPVLYPAVLAGAVWLSEFHTVLVGLLGFHVVALVVGRDYEGGTPHR